MLFSYVKRSLLLWLHNKSRLSEQKKYLSETVWNFIGVYIINRTLHGRKEIRNLFSAREEKFHISAWPRNIICLSPFKSRKDLATSPFP